MEKLGNRTLKQDSSFLRWGSFLLIITLFLALGGFLVHALAEPFSKSTMAEIKDTWTYYSIEDSKTTFKSRHVKRMKNISPNEIMVMERKMVSTVNDPTLLVQANHQWLDVYLGNQLLYTYQGVTADENNPGALLTEMNLPADYVGQTLRIELKSPYQNYTGIPARVFVGDSNSLMAYVLTTSMPQFLIMALSATITMVLLVILGMKLVKERFLDTGLLMLACFAMTIALEAIAGDLISGMLFSPTVNSTLATVLALLTPLFLICFYCIKMKQTQKLYRYWVIFHVSTSLLLLLFAIITKIDLPEIKALTDSLNVFGTLVTALAVIAEAHNKNHFFLVCTPWIVLVALTHCFLYILSVSGNNLHLINLSGLLFSVILVVIFSYTLIEATVRNQKNKRQMSFLEVKTALLEENRKALLHQMDEAASLRKEFKQNLLVMRELGHDENIPGLLTHIDDLLVDAETLATITHYSEHSLTNLMLARFQRLAQHRSIDISFDIDLPEELPLADDDLIQILGHVMDHAFRESYRWTDPRKRRIQLTIDYHETYVLRCCYNDTKPNIFEQGITSPQTNQTDFDLMMLEALTKKYRGKLTRTNEDSLTAVEMTLPLR